MKLQEIIDSLPDKYSVEAEKILVKQVTAIEVNGLTNELADLLAFSISDHYNELAKAILEKNYQGKKIDLKTINQAVIEQNDEQYSLLHFTAQFGNQELLCYFLDNDIEISLGKGSFSPMHSLAFAKDVNKEDAEKIVSALVKKDPAIINQKDSLNLTPLHYAAYHDNMPVLETLADKGTHK